jgi:predicted outer membrane repeat protein
MRCVTPPCSASLQGGAVGVAGGATVAEFTGVVIEGNSALNGGALYVQSGRVSFTNSELKSNTAVGPKMVVEEGGCTSVGSCIFSVRGAINYHLSTLIWLTFLCIF